LARPECLNELGVFESYLLRSGALNTKSLNVVAFSLYHHSLKEAPLDINRITNYLADCYFRHQIQSPRRCSLGVLGVQELGPRRAKARNNGTATSRQFRRGTFGARSSDRVPRSASEFSTYFRSLFQATRHSANENDDEIEVVDYIRMLRAYPQLNGAARIDAGLYDVNSFRRSLGLSQVDCLYERRRETTS
jgi:hypothetical protein